MRNIILLLSIVAVQFMTAQNKANPFIGSHSGLLTWQKEVGTLEVMENKNFIITSYNATLQAETVTKGRWRTEDDHIVLTDIFGGETLLYKNDELCYITDRNSKSCKAKFYINLGLGDYFLKRKQEGC